MIVRIVNYVMSIHVDIKRISRCKITVKQCSIVISHFRSHWFPCLCRFTCFFALTYFILQLFLNVFFFNFDLLVSLLDCEHV